MDHSEKKELVELAHVTKTFPLASGTFTALDNIDLKIAQGQMAAITGKSGSGKSTLLNIISGIDQPTDGKVAIDGVRIDKLPEGDLASWRGKNMGVVFQFFQLLPTLTILENVVLPMDFCNTYPRRERKGRAELLLEQVGIIDQADKFPSTLSGGQQQRAAVARALANDPPVIIADEPTGNLDSHTASSIFELFGHLSQSGKTVIIVTHEKDFRHAFDKIIAISDGAIVPENITA